MFARQMSPSLRSTERSVRNSRKKSQNGVLMMFCKADAGTRYVARPEFEFSYDWTATVKVIYKKWVSNKNLRFIEDIRNRVC